MDPMAVIAKGLETLTRGRRVVFALPLALSHRPVKTLEDDMQT